MKTWSVCDHGLSFPSEIHEFDTRLHESHFHNLLRICNSPHESSHALRIYSFKSFINDELMLVSLCSLQNHAIKTREEAVDYTIKSGLFLPVQTIFEVRIF